VIRYCTRCVMPETRPDILFDEEGVCSACRHFEARAEVDWDQRGAELRALLDEHRSPDRSNYDCIVPASGGKDGTFQVLKVLEAGLNPLVVTATTCQLTEIGRENIESLKHLGVDYVEVTTNPILRRRMNRLALEQVGDISWPEHVAIFTVPVRVAVAYGIPLIVWGENSQNEYGGPATAAEDRVLNRRWLEEFGGLLGLRVSDLVGQAGIERKDLIQFTYPTDEDLARVGVTGLFLGYFMPWDGWTNALVAQGHGFKTYPTYVEGSLANYENLDNGQMGIHDYFKYLKYGFGRATDLACMQIRRERLARTDAVELVGLHDGRYPETYVGVPLTQVLDEMGMTREEFDAVCDRFTNRRLFKTTRQGELVRRPDGSPELDA
jgi:N-acetyl sugar amidotransferase